MAKSEVNLWRSVMHEDFPNGTVIDGAPASGVLQPDYVARFKIPKGTVVPDSIYLKDDGWRERFQATHYLILPTAKTMRSDAYRGALENLARNAVVRSTELATSN